MRKLAILSLLSLQLLTVGSCGAPQPAELPPQPSATATPCSSLAQSLDAYLAEKGSPLAGLGAEFVASGRRHDVDPRLIVAIAGAETSFGTRPGCRDSSGNVVENPYNAWNWFYKGDCPSPFASWEEGIDRVTAGLRRLYLDQGLTTIETIGPKYSPAEPETWIRNVTSFYQALGGDPQHLTFKAGEEVVCPSPVAPPSSPPLAVPFISQWEERHGACKGWGNCGPASAAMAFEYFGKRPEGLSDAEFVHWMRQQMTGQADSDANRYTDMEDIKAACAPDAIGLTCEDVGSVEEIKAAVESGKVVICAVDAQLLEPPQYAERFVSGEMRDHILVVRGFGEREGEQVVWVNDPLSNPQTLTEDGKVCPADGGPGYYTYASWSAALEAERYNGHLQAVAIGNDSGGPLILAPGPTAAPEVDITVVPATPGKPTPAAEEPERPVSSTPLWPQYRYNAQRTSYVPSSIGPAAPRLAWSFQAEAAISSPVIAADGTIYVASYGGTLYALDPAGATKWTYAAGETTNLAPSIAVRGDGVVLLAVGSSLHAVAADGSSAWKYTAAAPMSGLALGPDGTAYLYLGNGQVQALGLDGEWKWAAGTLDWEGFGELALASDGTVYAMTAKNVYAFTAGGQLKWRQETAPGITQFNTGITLDRAGTIYLNVASAARAAGFPPWVTLKALNPDGSYKYEDLRGPNTEEYYVDSTPAIGGDDTLYVSIRQMVQTELGPAQFQARSALGEVLRNYPLHTCTCSYPVVDQRETLYAVLCNGDLIALGAAGDLRWSLNVVRTADSEDCEADNMGLAIGSGVVYVSAGDRLYTVTDGGRELGPPGG